MLGFNSILTQIYHGRNMSQDQTAATSSPFGNNAAILAQAANDIRTQAITKAVPNNWLRVLRL